MSRRDPSKVTAVITQELLMRSPSHIETAEFSRLWPALWVAGFRLSLRMDMAGFLAGKPARVLGNLPLLALK
jgi:hypothetical protein